MKLVSTRRKKNQQKRQLIQLDETLNDFVFGNNVNSNVSESEKLKQQTNGQPNGFKRFDKSARQNQIIKNNFDDHITRAFSSAVMTVEKCMHDAILTAIGKVVIPRIEMAMKSITGSTVHWTNSEVQNPDRKDFLGNIRNTPLMSASSRLDLDNELTRIDETRNNEDFENGDFPALRPNYDRGAQAHHNHNHINKFQV